MQPNQKSRAHCVRSNVHVRTGTHPDQVPKTFTDQKQHLEREISKKKVPTQERQSQRNGK